MALYNLGVYAEDDWSAARNLKLTLSLRVDQNSNPVCLHNCFARLALPFDRLVHDSNVPYNQVIRTGLHSAFPGYTQWAIQPRFGFAWSLFGQQTTVLRGGFGIFTDAFPATITDNFSQNPPLDPSYTIVGSIVNSPLSPASPGNIFQVATQSNTAFQQGFASGGTLASISAASPGFAPPSFFSSDPVVRSPRYQEWNLELERALGPRTSVSVNYVGNHGLFEPVLNSAVNAYASGFTGLPATAPDPRFGQVTQLQNAGISHYNGVTISAERRFSNHLQWGINYTWSHALDVVSNGGFLQYNLLTDPSILWPQDPNNIRRYNYGNADYDTRHYFRANYVWDVPLASAWHSGPGALLGGWQVAGTVFARSGLPFSVVDSGPIPSLSGSNYGGGQNFYLANQIAPGQAVNCNADKPCLQSAWFSPSTGSPTGFGNQRRNQFYGPHFWDTDLTLMKSTGIPGWENGRLKLGFQFFNLFNHVNFDQPVSDIANSQFGLVTKAVSVPTSVLGSFLGGDASPRIIQLKAQLNF
jgi:hypothetical protein